MPTPADIRKSALEWMDLDRESIERAERHKNPQLETTAKPAEPRVIDVVPWYGMTYEGICRANMLNQVKDWITDELKPINKHEDYIKYLKSFCGFPQDFTGKSEL